jgi:hypothetical protein
VRVLLSLLLITRRPPDGGQFLPCLTSITGLCLARFARFQAALSPRWTSASCRRTAACFSGAVIIGEWSSDSSTRIPPS